MGRMTGHSPGKERSHSKRRVQRRVGIGTGPLVQLAASPQPVQRVKQSRTHETHESEKHHLGVCVCEDASKACWTRVIL